MSIDSISLKPLFTPLVQVSWKDYCRGVDEGCLKLISERMRELIIQFYESRNRAAKPWTRSYLVTCSITYPPYKGIIHCWRGCFTFVLRDILEGSYFSWVLLSYRTSSWRACFLITFWSYFQFISPTWKYSSAAITSCFRQLLDPSWWSLLISDSDLAHLISNSSPARAALEAWADLQRITDERALLWAFLCHQLQSLSVSSALEQPTLMLWEVSEQTLSRSPPAAPCMAVPNTLVCQHRPCRVVPWERGDKELYTAGLRQWLGGPIPAHLQPCSPHTWIMVPSSPLQQKAWKPEPDARFHLSLQTAWKQ